jgi:DNA-binding NarL/FixJ family response regulator
MFEGDVDAQRALDAGARGYLFKSMGQHELSATIRAVHSGKTCVPPDFAARIAAYQGREVLTSRELDVLQRVADGGRNAEIATQLGIKEETVKAHVRTILAKLNARSRAHAVTIGIRRGFIAGLSSSPT